MGCQVIFRVARIFDGLAVIGKGCPAFPAPYVMHAFDTAMQ
jgi:hypothetical protein